MAQKSYSRLIHTQQERTGIILKMLQKGDFPSRKVLAQECGTTTKTIQRDINFLRDRQNMPIEYNPLKYGYYLTAPVRNFPLIHVSQAEIVAMFIAQKALCQYEGTPFAQPLKAAFRKFAESLGPELLVSIQELDSSFSFTTTRTKASDVENFRLISSALQNQLVIKFHYRKPGKTSFEKRCIQPYHLGCIKDQWYLFGFDIIRQDFPSPHFLDTIN